MRSYRLSVQPNAMQTDELLYCVLNLWQINLIWFDISYKTESVCLFCVCQYVSLLLIHGNNFQRIWAKFGVWHPYILWMVTGRLASAACAYRLALRAPSIYVAANGWWARSGIRAATDREPQVRDRAPQARAVTERRKREGAPLVFAYLHSRQRYVIWLSAFDVLFMHWL